MTTAIKRKKPVGLPPAGFQDAAIKSVLNIPHAPHCNKSKCNCISPCINCKCNKPRLNPLAIIALTRYRDELTSMEITRELSSLVDCCNVILMANEGARNG